jgi:DNA-binding transcriptional LysR family regulator
MPRSGRRVDVSTETLRIFVVVVESGSFADAAELLGISQSTIIVHMKRLEAQVGGQIFEDSRGEKLPTARGKVALALAQNVLDANDQILSFGGRSNGAQRPRIGMTTNYAEYLLASLEEKGILHQVQITTNYSAGLARSLVDGDLDIACIANAPAELGEPSFTWVEDFVWVCSKAFALKHGRPIPLVACGGILGDHMMGALEKSKMDFSTVFSSPDHHARLMATAAGLGITVLPLRHVREPLTVAKFSLPPIAPLRMDILVRKTIEPAEVANLMVILKALAPPNVRPRQMGTTAAPSA